ncbi:MAG: methionyl-tRNA formyltransferase [Bacteroidales bacterium]|nr:methionyl-tRNA formyltransferase [Bacteroidales bacterium]
MGTPHFAAGVLSFLIGKGYLVKGVVTAPDRPAGRGLTLRTSAVKKLAIEHGLPILQPESLTDPLFLESLSQWQAPLFVVVAFRMLPYQVWQMPALGCFNLHASLLPQYRGAAPINHVLINGEQETGLSTFLIDRQIDTGDLLLQEILSVENTDNAGTLHNKLMEAGGPLVAKTIDGLWDGSLNPIPQSSVPVEQLKPAPKITRETCRINWNHNPERIVNLIRGLSPIPCAFSTLGKNGEGPDIKICHARAEHTVCNAPPGTVVTDRKKVLKVACRQGYVHLLELQVPGKRRISSEAFLAGYREKGPLSFQSSL